MKQTTDTCLNSSLNINEQYHHASVIVRLLAGYEKNTRVEIVLEEKNRKCEAGNET